MKPCLDARDARDGNTQHRSDVSPHAWLAKRMDGLSGSDLTRAMETANLTTSDWSAMVKDCEGCRSAQNCQVFLTLFAPDNAQPAGDRRQNAGRFRVLQCTLEEMGHG